MRRLPPLGALEAFVAIARQANLGAAARELSLSPSALSRRVQALEAHVGRRMFERLNGEFRLTADGQALLGDIAPALDGLGQALERTRSAPGEAIRIGVMPAFANAWLMPRLQRFKAAHPRVDLALDTMSRPLSRLGAGVDAAIIIAEQAEAGLYSRQLCQQELLIVCAPELQQGAAPLRRPQDIAGQTVLLHRNMPGLLDLWLLALAVDARPARVEYFDSGPMLVEAACLGMGAALVFDTMVPAHLERGQLIAPFGERVDSPLNYWFFCRPPALDGRTLRHFHDWLFEETARTGEARAQLGAPRSRAG